VVYRNEAYAHIGKARRFSGSPLIDVLERLQEAQTIEAAPLIAGWLQPHLVDEGYAAGDGPRPWLRNQWLRQSAVECLGELTAVTWEWAAEIEEAQALAAEEEEAEEEEEEEEEDEEEYEYDLEVLEANLILSLQVLEAALSDPRGVVRTAAIRAVAWFGDHELPSGASLEAEEEALRVARAWLGEWKAELEAEDEEEEEE
jgi:hypothetical protein